MLTQKQIFIPLPSDLRDDEWAFIRPLLPPPATTGRPRANDRKTINGILYVLRTGCRWEDLPPERYGSSVTCWRRFSQWRESRVWEKIGRILLLELNRKRKLNLNNAYLDTSVRQNKRGLKIK
jgi:transposase